jgi:hypothetical protein
VVTLADQLIPILTQEAREAYMKCGRKQAYPTLGDATKVALRRSQAGGIPLYAYPCPHNQEHFHLSHRYPTRAQIEAMSAFSSKQVRRVELELRQLKRTARELEVKLRATRSRFKRVLDASWGGTPFPSRIQQHYAALRKLLADACQCGGEYLAAVYTYNARLEVMNVCRDFAVPGSAWRAAAEEKLAELTSWIDAIADQAAQVYDEELQELDEMEARDLAACRDALSTRYGATG